MVVGSNTHEMKEEKMLTDDEAALYDRQLRLWGVEAQKRLISSKILVIGMAGLGAEICKNIILGGVKSVTLMDDALATEHDVLTQFFLPKDAVGKNRAESSVANAQKLNPMVSVMTETSAIVDKPDSFYQDFSVIVTIGCDRNQVLRLNRLARLNGIPFFAADVYGFSSFMFSDLGEHEYKKEVITPATKQTPEVVKVVDGILRYVPFQDLLNLDWNMEELAKRVKKMNPSFFTLFVIWEFIATHKRRPDPSQRKDDYQELLTCRDDYADKHGISKEKIPDEYFENVFGELPPVAAITGGVIAQEIVKAISHKDVPLINLFAYNFVAGTGYVENFAN